MIESKNLQERHDKRPGDQQSVKPVEETAMTGQGGAAVFDFDASLEERFHQVAINSTYDDKASDDEPLPEN